MIIECIDSAGFEDQLTQGCRYTLEPRGDIGDNSYFIEADNETFRWYGAYRFKIRSE